MRIRILDRILVALAGLALVAACAGLVAQVFFNVDVIGFVTQLLKAGTGVLQRGCTWSCYTAAEG